MLAQFTVLLVEDSIDKRELLKVALEMAGYHVITAEDGLEGLAKVESHAVDLIVTDTGMPRMDGFEMVRRVRANPSTRFIPVIIQTAARGGADDIRRGADVGALGYITDPTDLDLLLARARTLLDFKSYLDTAEEAAFTDELTGMGNRRRFKRQLEREVTRSRSYGRPFCLCLFEVDGFARLNDVFGVPAAERVLRHVGDTILAGTRAIDTNARLEQALFAVAVTETAYEGVLEVAERLSAAVGGHAVPGVNEPVTVSFGIAEFPTAAADAEGLMEAAHLALAEAKRSRRATFEKAAEWARQFAASAGRAEPPSCFLSYAWSTPENDDWVAALAKDLRGAGIKAVLDRRDNAAIGRSIPRFVSSIKACDFVAVVGTRRYLEKYNNKVSATGSVVAAEVDVIATRLIGPEGAKDTVLPLLREGAPEEVLPPLMLGRVCADFRGEGKYFESLFDLVLTLYGVPFDHPTAEAFRESLRGRK
jgi:diguanylate cyclase (GGDEF)-like protein